MTTSKNLSKKFKDFLTQKNTIPKDMYIEKLESLCGLAIEYCGVLEKQYDRCNADLNKALDKIINN